MCLCPKAVIKWQPCKASLASPNKTIFPRPCMWPLLRLVESCIWLEVAKTRETNKIDTCHPKWMLVRGADFKCQLLTRRAPCTHPRLHIGRRGVLMGRRVQREAWTWEPGCSHHNWQCVILVTCGGIQSEALTDKGHMFTLECGSNGRLGHPQAKGHRYLFWSDFPCILDYFFRNQGKWWPYLVLITTLEFCVPEIAKSRWILFSNLTHFCV